MSDIDKELTIAKLVGRALIAGHLDTESAEVPAKLTIVRRGRSLLTRPEGNAELDGKSSEGAISSPRYPS